MKNDNVSEFMKRTKLYLLALLWTYFLGTWTIPDCQGIVEYVIQNGIQNPSLYFIWLLNAMFPTFILVLMTIAAIDAEYNDEEEEYELIK